MQGTFGSDPDLFFSVFFFAFSSDSVTNSPTSGGFNFFLLSHKNSNEIYYVDGSFQEMNRLYNMYYNNSTFKR